MSQTVVAVIIIAVVVVTEIVVVVVIVAKSDYMPQSYLGDKGVRPIAVVVVQHTKCHKTWLHDLL